MLSFVFTNTAKKEFSKLQTRLQERVLNKLKALKSHPNIMSCLKSVHDLEPATHRLRIGQYRLLLREDEEGFVVLRIRHRRDVYQ